MLKPLFYSVLLTVFLINLDQIITPQKAKLGPDNISTAYIYICCRRGIWSPQGGDLVPSTLPAAEPSILARGKIGNLSCANRGVFRAQIPRVRGPNSLPNRFSQKRPSKQSPTKARNHYFYSVFVHFGAFFQECPKNTEKPSCRVCYYLMSFSRGLFSYKFPFFFFSNFKLARFSHSDLRTVLKPIFL